MASPNFSARSTTASRPTYQEKQTTARPTRLPDAKERQRTIRLGFIGLGYVGLPLAILAAEKGYHIDGFDIDTRRIQNLTKGKASYISPTEAEAFAKYQHNMRFSTDPSILDGADVFFMCVPTPINRERMPDLSAVVEASRTIARALRPGALVIVESSVNPGVCDDVILPILTYETNLKVEKDFFFAYCPERVNPGDDAYSTKNIPRVIGAAGKGSMESARAVYESILEAPLKPMAQIKEAEAVKMVENAFRDINIAFVNELAMAFAREGIDVVNVIDGAATKPFAFMPHYPGCGVGGHCIPVDPHYLIQYGKQHGFTHNLLIQARETNSYMPHYTLALLRKALYDRHHSMRGAKIALLGLSYKKGVGDLRESPALEMREELIREGAEVISYDPYALEESSVGDLAAALQGATAAIIATNHDEFCRLTPADFEAAGVSIVIDGRNCLAYNEFRNSPIAYRGIGRTPEQA